MPAKKLKDYLDQNGIKYVVVTHSPAFTAQEVAAAAHISGWALAKTVMIKIDNTLAMAVLPANQRIIIQDLREMVGTENVQFASESEFRAAFPGCETGAMPPFGNLYDMEVYASPGLASSREIAFNAGTHTELIKMSYEDFARLVHPKVLEFTT